MVQKSNAGEGGTAEEAIRRKQRGYCCLAPG